MKDKLDKLHAAGNVAAAVLVGTTAVNWARDPKEKPSSLFVATETVAATVLTTSVVFGVFEYVKLASRISRRRTLRDWIQTHNAPRINGRELPPVIFEVVKGIFPEETVLKTMTFPEISVKDSLKAIYNVEWDAVHKPGFVEKADSETELYVSWAVAIGCGITGMICAAIFSS